MRFGACVGLDRVSVLEKYGYDFFELGVSSLLPEALDSEFIPVKEKAKSFRIKPEAYNVFIKGELKLTGEEVDFDRVIRYVETAVRRAAALGGKIIVFGSGTARRVPDGFPKEKAYEQLKKFLNMVADNAGKHRITIAIEPLNREETNILNSVEEAVWLAKEVNRAEIRVLADIYHMIKENESFDSIIKAGDYIVHIHLSDPDRFYPGRGEYAEIKDFFSALKKIGYEERISAECRWENFEEECPGVLAYMKSVWSNA